MTESLGKADRNGKALGLKLVRRWEGLLEQEGLAPEVVYRLRKIRQGLLPLLDRLYLKTLKGQEMLLKCTEQTRVLQERLPPSDENLYILLTNLERTCEELFQKIYEFRVKAG